MSLTEPTTLLTDYALGALCLWLGWKLYALAAFQRQTSLKLWAGAFYLLYRGGKVLGAERE